jgi:hypothetical protein
MSVGGCSELIRFSGKLFMADAFKAKIQPPFFLFVIFENSHPQQVGNGLDTRVFCQKICTANLSRQTHCARINLFEVSLALSRPAAALLHWRKSHKSPYKMFLVRIKIHIVKKIASEYIAQNDEFLSFFFFCNYFPSILRCVCMRRSN